jgi:hypothetical protein
VRSIWSPGSRETASLVEGRLQDRSGASPAPGRHIAQALTCANQPGPSRQAHRQTPRAHGRDGLSDAGESRTGHPGSAARGERPRPGTLRKGAAWPYRGSDIDRTSAMPLSDLQKCAGGAPKGTAPSVTDQWLRAEWDPKTVHGIIGLFAPEVPPIRRPSPARGSLTL